MPSRRTFLKDTASLTALTVTSLKGRSHGSPPIHFAKQADRARARQRRRRIAWNNDGSDMLQTAYAGGKWRVPLKSVDQFLGGTQKYIEGTQVDSIFYCAHVNQPDWEFPRQHIQVLGSNPVKPVVDFAHRHGMEFFYSIRMNDVHAGRYPPKDSYWPPFRLKHPELLLGYVSQQHWEQKILPWIQRYIRAAKEDSERQLHDPEKELELRRQSDEEHPLADVIRRNGVASRDLWFWAGYNWALPQVQTRYLDVIDEACQRYDLDGIELDWCRHTMFFKLGEEQRNLPIISDFVHRVRQRLDYYGEKRDRPILLAMRVPDTLPLCISLGLDPATWVREGWIDLIMAGTGLTPFSIPMTDWVNLAHSFEIPAYGCLDRLYPTFRTGRPKFDFRDPEMDQDIASDYDSVRAAAYRLWAEGVDGIYLYDWHTHHGPTDPKDYGTVPEVGEPKPLARQNKLYRIDTDYSGSGGIANGTLAALLPRVFTTQSGANSARFAFSIADTPDSARRVSLQTQWRQSPDFGRFSWKLNGLPLSTPKAFSSKGYGVHLGVTAPGNYGFGFKEEPGWSILEMTPSSLKKGVNTLEVRIEPLELRDSAESVELAQVRISIRYS